jgi:hypothetical protein
MRPPRMPERVWHFPFSVQEAFPVGRSTCVAHVLGFTCATSDDRRPLAPGLVGARVRMRDAPFPQVGRGMTSSTRVSQTWRPVRHYSFRGTKDVLSRTTLNSMLE